MDRHSGSWRAALVLTAGLVPPPVYAAIITAFVFIDRPQGLWGISAEFPILSGWIATLLLWFSISWFFRKLTSFEVMNGQSGNHLLRHLLNLYSFLRLIKEHLHTNSDTDDGIVAFRNQCHDQYDIALDCVYKNVCAANKQLCDDPLRFVMGNGYLRAWHYVLRAEEALLNVVPRDMVVREALHDEAAIDGSDIAGRDLILGNIKRAVKILDPEMGRYLKSLREQDCDPCAADGEDQARPAPAFTKGATADHHQSGAAARAKTPDIVKVIAARNALRDARQTLDDFRIGQWDGLVRLRNQTFATAMLTGIFTYVLLCVAIIAGVGIVAMKTAAAYYLVGAIVGLFSRLYTEGQSDSAIDDYGLTVARVMITPVISGLAAIAGVMVVAFLSLNLFNTPGTKPGELPGLDVIYNLSANPQGILIAAIFGLTPNLLVNTLQQRANDVTSKLKNSAASNQKD